MSISPAGTGPSNGSRRCDATCCTGPAVAATGRRPRRRCRSPPSTARALLFASRDPVPALGERGGDPQRLEPAPRWDLPIQRFVERHRTDDLTSFFLGASRLGSTPVVVAVSACLTVLTWRRCLRWWASRSSSRRWRGRSSSSSSKPLVARDRPDFEQASPVGGRGFSVPERSRHGRDRVVRTRAARRCALHVAPRAVVGLRRRVRNPRSG